eukprot:TRINITY_DN36182_c0_g1_i1.p1 TRINITY_DN36182_c0_g1~~TRINITY_DN36182_c0_g1_i1.p1  ORF type:complete len:362 (-),score=76.80 TRINITY_DN36182_c0_g1_i1:378-1463(-)
MLSVLLLPQASAASVSCPWNGTRAVAGGAGIVEKRRDRSLKAGAGLSEPCFFHATRHFTPAIYTTTGGESSRCSNARNQPLVAPPRASAVPSSTPAEKQQDQQDASCVLVVGASGGVGQLVVAALLERGVPVKALIRNREKAQELFGDADKQLLQVISADTRFPASLKEAEADLKGVNAVVVTTGTTAFPTQRWKDDNGPKQTDVVGMRNLLDALLPAASSIRRLVLVSSAGVTRYGSFPYNILNLFGVLECKKQKEEMVKESQIPYTILRPGRLTDGPYTSYDLNTLLRATAGLRRAACVELGDRLPGETSRVLLAEACVQALSLDSASGKEFCITSAEGPGGPEKDPAAWDRLFQAARH